MAKEAAPNTIYLKDYEPPAWRTEETHLEVDIRDGVTQVSSRLLVRRDPEAAGGAEAPLVLDGEELELVSVAVDGRPLGGNEFRVGEGALELFSLPAACELSIVTRIQPEKNTALIGLYKSRSVYCTQCEAQGFRRITYYQDRPDVLSRYTTTIVADAQRYPVLLANGNLIEESEAAGRRRATWHDPFPKPSYLFALVAGDLALMTDTFTTVGGRTVELRIYSEPHNIGHCEFAMGALKRAMRWDEERFGREYDLDIYMIVAVEDFNAGAMENKGLNIFNAAYVLISPDIAVDAAYQRVEGVIAHEYFHNWSGNRVTCRDWFQLSLKEGFTVFRDAEFTSDTHWRPVKRINDVMKLRSLQFAEDGGPMAHPVRPDSYIEISNFYTVTVYEKGAEVVGMLRTLVGDAGFRKGTDLYFERHDGQAVTTEDFVAAMEDANGVDLVQFRRWYAQAGTPVLRVRTQWGDGELAIAIEQSCPATPRQPRKEPLHIPVLIGLVGAAGEERIDGELEIAGDARVERRGTSLLVEVRNPETTLRLGGLDSEPALSFLRGFSAPVRVDYQRPTATLALLARNDGDGFARWDALQSLVLDELANIQAGGEVSPLLIGLYAGLAEEALAATDAERKSILNEMLALPSEEYLFALSERIDLDAVCAARDALKQALAERLCDLWRRLYEANAPQGPYVWDAMGVARRGVRNLALGYLAAGLGEAAHGLLSRQLESADNLTDRMAALREITDSGTHPDRAGLLAGFYDRWRHENLVVDQWLQMQARSPRNGAAAIAELERHPAFDVRNPNKVRALYGTFGMLNRNFHAADGLGYNFLVDRIIERDAENPQVAARLATPLTRWQKFDAGRQELMRAALRRILAVSDEAPDGARGISKDLFEVVSKSLDQP